MKNVAREMKELYVDFDTDEAKLFDSSTVSTPIGTVVADHHHDTEQGVYRLTYGKGTRHIMPEVDDHGAIILDGDEPKMVEVIDIEVAGDIVFAADDERWKDKTTKQIAAEQRAIVKQALAEHEAKAQAQGRRRRGAIKPMPGIGNTL